MVSRSGRSRSADSSPRAAKSPAGSHRIVTRRSARLLHSARRPNDPKRSSPDPHGTPGKMLSKKLPEPVTDQDEIGKGEKAEAEDTQLEENTRTPAKASETLEQADESEAIGQTHETKRDTEEEMKREVEKSPRLKGKRKKTRNSSLESTFVSPNDQYDGTDSENDLEILEPPSLESKEMSSCPEEETDPNFDPNFDLTIKEKILKRKPLDRVSPEKKIRIECEPEVPNIVAEEKPDGGIRTDQCKDLDEELLENESKEMPSLTAESDQHLQDPANEEFETLLAEMDSIAYTGQEEEIGNASPQILGEKHKSCDVPVAEKSASNPPTSDPPALPLSLLANLSEALLSLVQDESRSIKSESDINIEADSEAEGSQEGLCESESANESEDSATSSDCGIIEETDLKEKAESSDSEDLPTLDNKLTPMEHSHTTSQKLARSPARVTSPPVKDMEKDKHGEKPQDAPAKTYKWSFSNEILETMASDERIDFMQDKLQEMRQCYGSLKSEVAAIDHRIKRLKKRRRKVSHPGASTSSASSEPGMTPSSSSSSSPPQNTVTVECR